MSAAEESVTQPDWEFDTNEDLRSHAKDLVAWFSARLMEMEDNDERPEGTAAHTYLVIPCPDPNNVTRQAIYTGYCAEACREQGLVVRGFQCVEDDGHYMVNLVICSAEALALAHAEWLAEQNPERTPRSH